MQHLRPSDTLGQPHQQPVIKCARCGERLFVPECSEYVDGRRVRHVWKCEPCDYSFEATICAAARRA